MHFRLHPLVRLDLLKVHTVVEDSYELQSGFYRKIFHRTEEYSILRLSCGAAWFAAIARFLCIVSRERFLQIFKSTSKGSHVFLRKELGIHGVKACLAELRNGRGFF